MREKLKHAAYNSDAFLGVLLQLKTKIPALDVSESTLGRPPPRNCTVLLYVRLYICGERNENDRKNGKSRIFESKI